MKGMISDTNDIFCLQVKTKKLKVTLMFLLYETIRLAKGNKGEHWVGVAVAVT